jgi:hypothetical protein
MPPRTGVASGFMTSEPVEVLHMIGSETGDHGRDRHDLGPQRSKRPP